MTHLIITVVVVLLLVGLALWIVPDSIAQLVWNSPLGYIPHYAITVEQTRELGNQLVGGAAVAFAVLIAEVFITRRIQQENERENERRNMQLTLSPARDLRGIDLQGRRLGGFFLPSKDFRRATLQYADLSGAVLTSCNFSNSNLSGADLSNANAQYSSFSTAVLKEAILIETKLRNVKFDQADLRDANLEGANLRGANLEGANLHGANLHGANLHGVAGLTDVDVSRARGNKNTELPDYLERPEWWT